jgi:diphthamide biosynthesis protein 7
MCRQTTAVSLQSEDTIYSADSIEFCPVRPDIFVCGTYQIEKLDEDQSPSREDETDPDTLEDQYSSGPATRRLGRALVYRLAEDEQSL